jgi:hypothetical protein
MKNPKLLLLRVTCSLVLVGLVGAVPRLHAAGDDDFDSYAIKITAAWFYSNPSGTLQSAIGSGLIDLKKDIGYSHERSRSRARLSSLVSPRRAN